MLLARRWQGPDELEIGAGGESRLRAFEGVLSIVAALETDAGNYTCVVENTAGVRRRPVSIVVSGQFSSGSLLPSVSSSSSVSLICRSLACLFCLLPHLCLTYSISERCRRRGCCCCCSCWPAQPGVFITLSAPHVHHSRHLLSIPVGSVVCHTCFRENDRIAALSKSLQLRDSAASNKNIC